MSDKSKQFKRPDPKEQQQVERVSSSGIRGGFGWGRFLGLVVLLAAPALAVWRLLPVQVGQGVAGWVLVVSLLTFWIYRTDKRRAQGGAWRIPEKLLHFVAFLGGWPGALVAQGVVRHKTAKLSFLLVFWLIVLIHQYLAIDALSGWQILESSKGWLEQL